MEDIFEELAAAASDEEERAEENVQEARPDEAEEADGESRRVVKPKRTITRAPRPKLDPARLLGPRGIFVLSSTFDNIKFKGKGGELDDLNNILSRLQHWAHRLFPKMTFEDCIERIEELGHKREIQINMHKLRMGMVDLNGQHEQIIENDEVRAASPDPPEDTAFDQLITTVPAPAKEITLTDEQRARMLRNRLLAEERRMARRLAREKELEEQRQAASRGPDQTTLNEGNATDEESSQVLASNLATSSSSSLHLDPSIVHTPTDVHELPREQQQTSDLDQNGTPNEEIAIDQESSQVLTSNMLTTRRSPLHSESTVASIISELPPTALQEDSTFTAPRSETDNTPQKLNQPSDVAVGISKGVPSTPMDLDIESSDNDPQLSSVQ